MYQNKCCLPVRPRFATRRFELLCLCLYLRLRPYPLQMPLSAEAPQAGKSRAMPKIFVFSCCILLSLWLWFFWVSHRSVFVHSCIPHQESGELLIVATGAAINTGRFDLFHFSPSPLVSGGSMLALILYRKEKGKTITHFDPQNG